MKFAAERYELPRSELRFFADTMDTFGFVDVERLDASTEIVFNGNLFRRDEVGKIRRVLDGLKDHEKRVVGDICEKLRASPCMVAGEAANILGAELLNKLVAIGFFDKTILSNETGNVLYISLPSSFKKYGSGLVDDPLDLAKEFVASLTYGMKQSSYARGQITMIGKLIQNLIKGQWVGPVTAIGQDYKTLELKRAVEVKSFSRNNRYGPNLRLLKPEMGDISLHAIMQGSASEESLPNFPGSAVTKFNRPEVQREAIRRTQSPEDKGAMSEILFHLRTRG